jgi:hypothetical protein
MLKQLFGTVLAALSAGAAGQSASQFMEGARQGLALQTSGHASTWQLGQEEDWSADLDTGQLVLKFSKGVTATARIQVVGTYNKADGTFLWGWDHPSVPEPLRQHALLAKKWGEQNQVPAYTSRKVKCSEDEAWTFAAVANRLANANGVYRGPAGTAFVFMTFGEVKLEKR